MDLDNVQKPFIWRKKYEEQGVKIDDKQIEAEAKRRAEENKIELEKIRERQRRRELEYQQKLSDGEFLQRQKEAEQHEHWEQQEDDFILKQHRQRSKIRIRDGRAKPIDLFAHYIDVFGFKPEENQKKEIAYRQEEPIDLGDSPIELLNPCDWFTSLRHSDLESLVPDIEIYMNADYQDNQIYWKDLLEITKDELSKLHTASEQSDIDSTILQSMVSLFDDKTPDELDELEDEVIDKLETDDPSIDFAFYKVVLSRLRAHRAKLRLTSDHKQNLKYHKDKFLPPKKETEDEKEGLEGVGESEKADKALREEELRDICIQEYRTYDYSPKLIRGDQLSPGIICTEFAKEYVDLERQRDQISGESAMRKDDQAFMEAASKGMDSREESVFNCEAAIRGGQTSYAWADKYQPRKPRYFNRIHTGFEWNKYNQTHYDVDNPPPKVVQGYKFNIFYPDLIDKSKAPQFSLTPCKEDKDFCIIRFSAGPPYEDIAFKIVNREWNSSHKSGYRCQFINNVLQLWFQFKRYRYRR